MPSGHRRWSGRTTTTTAQSTSCVTGRAEDGPIVFENPREGKFHRASSPGPRRLSASADGHCRCSISTMMAGWILRFTHRHALLASRSGATINGKTLLRASRFPRPTGSAPTASPPSTTTTTAGSISSPSARRKTARARSGSSAISVPTASKTSPPTSASTRFISKARAPSSPATTTTTAPPTCSSRRITAPPCCCATRAQQNHWLRLSLKGLNDNKSAIGTKVEVFSGGNRQKFEIYGSNGYLGQNSTDIVVGLGQSKEADIVRMLWPTGVLQDEIQICRRQAPRISRDRPPRQFLPDALRLERRALRIRRRHAGRRRRRPLDRPQPARHPAPRRVHQDRSQHDSEKEDLRPQTSDLGKNGLAEVQDAKVDASLLSFRFMEPLEEAVYLDQVRLLAVDHPADVDVYPNEYFASNPPYPQFKVVVSRDAQSACRRMGRARPQRAARTARASLLRRFCVDAIPGIRQAAHPDARSRRALHRRPALAADAR